MPKRVLLMLKHAVEEFQQLDLLTSLGYQVFSIGAYTDPTDPGSDRRPALDIPVYPELIEACEAIKPQDPQEAIPSAVLDWLGDAGIIIQHHHLESLYAQWSRLYDWKLGGQGRRIVWRSVGQSVENNERAAQPFRMAGLERVAYSPKEANIPGYVGHDVLIRFWGAEAEFGWQGALHREGRVINITQDLRQREPYTNWSYWESATKGLSRRTYGPGSEVIDGAGAIPFQMMQDVLREERAYLYAGTQPASYTLGLIEAMMAGVPVVSIGPAWMRVFPYGKDLFEAHELVPLGGYDDPMEARRILRRLLEDDDYAAQASTDTLDAARSLFDRSTIGAQWAEFLG